MLDPSKKILAHPPNKFFLEHKKNLGPLPKKIFFDPLQKMVLVLLSASVKRFCVSLWEFFNMLTRKKMDCVTFSFHHYWQFEMMEYVGPESVFPLPAAMLYGSVMEGRCSGDPPLMSAWHCSWPVAIFTASGRQVLIPSQLTLGNS